MKYRPAAIVLTTDGQAAIVDAHRQVWQDGTVVGRSKDRATRIFRTGQREVAITIDGERQVARCIPTGLRHGQVENTLVWNTIARYLRSSTRSHDVGEMLVELRANLEEVTGHGKSPLHQVTPPLSVQTTGSLRAPFRVGRVVPPTDQPFSR